MKDYILNGGICNKRFCHKMEHDNFSYMVTGIDNKNAYRHDERGYRDHAGEQTFILYLKISNNKISEKTEERPLEGLLNDLEIELKVN